MLSSWQTFAATVRGSVSGSIIVAELLQAILDGESLLVQTIIAENLYDKKLKELARQVEVHSTSLSGRVEISRVLNEHLFISGVPTDDLSLRRVYLRWRSYRVKHGAEATG